MSSTGSFKAIVNLANLPKEVEDLKRLALIFDEIYYIHPQLYCLEDLPWDKANGFQFNLFRDCVVYDVMTFDELNETLTILGEAGIAKGIHARGETLEELRRDIAIIDEKDPEFQKITPNSPPAVMPFGTKHLNGPEEGLQSQLIGVAPSMVIWDSLILTNTLFLANKEGLFPVFLEPRHRREMEYRYNQYKQQSSKIASAYPELVSPVNFTTHFGEVTFSIFGDIWPHELLMNKGLEEIITYRINMTPARKKYIASLTELLDMAENNPWNQKTKNDLIKYILKLEADLATYRQGADNIWRKMFHDVTLHATDAIVKGVAGGLTGRQLSGILAPQLSDWGLVLAGALMGSSKAIPQVVKTILDFRRTREEHKSSAIAYIAEFK
ncbi:MAG: hypothetical protein AB1649_29400 [Chloroflexota bacterium]